MLTNKKSEDTRSPVIIWLAKYPKQMSPAGGPENKTSQELRKPPYTSYLESQVLMQYLSVMSVSFVLV